MSTPRTVRELPERRLPIRWVLLDLPQFPQLRVLELRQKRGIALIAFHVETGVFLGRNDYPTIVYDPHHNLQPVYEVRMKFIKQSLAKANDNNVPVACGDATFAKKCPAVFEFVTCSRHEDGSSRITSTITITYHEGMFKAFLNDRDSQKSTCASAATLATLWEALESRITSEDPGWRALPQHGGPKRQGGQGKKT